MGRRENANLIAAGRNRFRERLKSFLPKNSGSHALGVRGLFVAFSLSFVLLPGLTIVWGQTTGESQPRAPRIQVIPDQYDFGKVPPEKLSHTFVVKNIGESDLEIYHVSTSCGCTTASIDKKTIQPGNTAEMVVNSDPNFHGPLEGETPLLLTRSIYIRSNDPENPEKSVFITATITQGE